MSIDRASVDRLVDARCQQRAMPELPPSGRPRDARAAYALQDALHLALGDAGLGPVVGHKIGCTTRVMQEYLKIDSPCAGGVLESNVRHGDGDFAHADFVRVGVECELAVMLARDLGMPGEPMSRDRVTDAVAGVMCAIEVVDDRWRDYRSIEPPSLIADDFFAAGCVLGAPRSRWRDLDLARISARMSINGDEVGRGQGADILGDPLAALEWLVDTCEMRGLVLEAGQFVLLGSMVQTQWLAPGDTVEIEVERLGRVQAHFRA